MTVESWAPLAALGGEGLTVVRAVRLERNAVRTTPQDDVHRPHPVGGAPPRHERSVVQPLDQELLAQDVGVPAVLGELAQHVQLDPAQRQGTASVAGQQVVQVQGGRGPAAR